MSERLVFSTSIEGLFVKGIGERLTPELRMELRLAGIDLDRPLLPAYPSAVYQRCIELVATRLYPGISMAGAQFQLGARAVLGMTETLVGATAVALSKLVGPRRALLRFPVSSMSSTNFSKMQAKELSPTRIELVSVPFEGHVEFLQGCVTSAITLTGGEKPVVQVVEHDRVRERAVVHASWAA